MAYLNLGTGIAAGIVADGELWRGARGTRARSATSRRTRRPAVPLRPARLHRRADRHDEVGDPGSNHGPEPSVLA